MQEEPGVIAFPMVVGPSSQHGIDLPDDLRQRHVSLLPFCHLADFSMEPCRDFLPTPTYRAVK